MKKSTARTTLAIILLFGAALLAGCGSKKDAMAGYPAADMTGYAALDGYDASLQFVEMTAAEADKLMEEKATFALFTSFPDCPWCNAVLTHVNDAALEAGKKVGNINTRRDPSWQNNMDIDDYDLFAARFGEYLEKDDDGTPHLYVPHIFFVKNGEVVYEHSGALPEMGNDPDMVLTPEQSDALTGIFREGFRLLE